MAGEPLRDVDESAPLRPDSPAAYSASGLHERGAAGRGEPHAPRLPHDERDTSLQLLLKQVMRDGRLRQVERARRLCDGSGIGDGDEASEGAERRHRRSL
jgi:hypothetical protein